MRIWIHSPAMKPPEVRLQKGPRGLGLKWKQFWFNNIQTVLAKYYHQKYFSVLVENSFLLILASSKSKLAIL